MRISLRSGTFSIFFLNISRTCRFILFRATAEPSARETIIAHRLRFNSLSCHMAVNDGHFHLLPVVKSCDISLFRFILRAFRKRYRCSVSKYFYFLLNRDLTIAWVSISTRVLKQLSLRATRSCWSSSIRPVPLGEVCLQTRWREAFASQKKEHG
jgi:hypothetical protein